MINITSKIRREYTITLGERDKVHMFNNIEKILSNNKNGTIVFNINAPRVYIEEEELVKMESYGVKINAVFANIAKVISANAIEQKRAIQPEIKEQKNSKVKVYKKIIRSGQTEVFKDGIILAENINKTGRVESYGGIVVLKKNFGVINVVDGSLIIDPNKNHGEIYMDGVDITGSLMENEEIKNASRVLIEKTQQDIKYEIY